MDIFEIAGTVFAGLIIGILGKFFAPGSKDNIPMGLAGMPRVMSGASDPRGGRVQLGARLGERLAQMPFDGSGVQPCHHIDTVSDLAVNITIGTRWAHQKSAGQAMRRSSALDPPRCSRSAMPSDRLDIEVGGARRTRSQSVGRRTGLSLSEAVRGLTRCGRGSNSDSTDSEGEKRGGRGNQFLHGCFLAL